MDETAAILAYQRGDAHAFDVLFELHAAHVYRTSYLIVRDAARAEDVAQETFLILAQRLPGLAPAPLRSWLGRVAANLSLNDRRRAQAVDIGTVSVLDARDGRLRGTWRIIDGPGAVVVDNQTDRVFVSSSDVSSGSLTYYIPLACRGPFGRIGCIVRSFAYSARELRKGRTGTVSTFDARTAP